ncbi:MAG TPA: 5'/3'-nucleotidase SurE [Anaerolineales bacterium]|jgi:5'-nucleotidase|nr:5'/3'-nucleotidase SurE [Anaerolineales bacterium]
MQILLTNDDGIHHPGLSALAQQLRSLGDLTVLAPDHNWSAAGHVKTLHRPLRVWEADLADGTKALTTDGAPSDCVALALLGLVQPLPDLVVSGINPHANLGHDVTYSGTVTAAMEAAIAGVPGIAISLDSPDHHEGPLDYSTAAVIASRLARQVLQHHLPDGVLLSVNVPYLSLESIRGVAITRQGLRVYRDALVRREDPRGRPYYWIGGDSPSGVADPGTDIGALAEGYVSVTPLKLDLTAMPEIPTIEGWGLTLE